MEESLIDKFLDRLGIITVEDEGVPMAGLSFNARDVGMIPDDKSKASHNVNLLIRTLNAHGRIVIDDKYYITTPYEQLKVREVEITGTTGAELIADNDYSSKLFDPALLKSITIRNVKFTNPSSTTVFLVAYNENGINSKVEKVDIRDCTFTGNISLYRQYGSGNPDPGNIDFGIGDFIFKNNVVTNTRFSFIVLVDIPVRYCEISRNSIENFTYMFLNISISNDEVYSDKLYDHISYLKVEDNMVVCGDGWWGDIFRSILYNCLI